MELFQKIYIVRR